MTRLQRLARIGNRSVGRRPCGWLLSAASLLLPIIGAAAPDDDGMSRQRADLAAGRQAVERRFQEKERDCQQRFAVTACLNAAQKERREALAPLRQEGIRIDTLERKQRAASRLEEIEAKQRSDAAKDAAAASSPDAGAARSPRDGSAVPRPAPSIAPRPASVTGLKPRQAISDDERQRREAANLARYQANQAAAQQRREAAEARNAKRAASGKSARPLPPPEGGASAP